MVILSNVRLCCDTRNNFVSQSGSFFQIYFFVVGNSTLTCFTAVLFSTRLAEFYDLGNLPIKNCVFPPIDFLYLCLCMLMCLCSSAFLPSRFVEVLCTNVCSFMCLVQWADKSMTPCLIRTQKKALNWL